MSNYRQVKGVIFSLIVSMLTPAVYADTQSATKSEVANPDRNKQERERRQRENQNRERQERERRQRENQNRERQERERRQREQQNRERQERERRQREQQNRERQERERRQREQQNRERQQRERRQREQQERERRERERRERERRDRDRSEQDRRERERRERERDRRERERRERERNEQDRRERERERERREREHRERERRERERREREREREERERREREERNRVRECTYSLFASQFNLESFVRTAYDQGSEAATRAAACRKAQSACEVSLIEARQRRSYRGFELRCEKPDFAYRFSDVVCKSKSSGVTFCPVVVSDSMYSSELYLKQFGDFENLSEYNLWLIENRSRINLVDEARKMAKICGPKGDQWGIDSEKKRVWVRGDCEGVFTTVNKWRVIEEPDHDPRQCDEANLQNCLDFGGGNACYAKWCSSGRRTPPKKEQPRQCNEANLNICLDHGGGNACYTKWCD